jgi:hypothetical protein
MTSVPSSCAQATVDSSTWLTTRPATRTAAMAGIVTTYETMSLPAT